MHHWVRHGEGRHLGTQPSSCQDASQSHARRSAAARGAHYGAAPAGLQLKDWFGPDRSVDVFVGEQQSSEAARSEPSHPIEG